MNRTNPIPLLIAMLVAMASSVFCDTVVAYHNRGISKENKGDLDGATKDYTEAATAIKSDNSVAYFNRGDSKQAAGDLEGAIADYTKVIELEPNCADAYITRGVVKQARGDLEGAIADYSNAIAVKPDEAMAYYNRGTAKRAKGTLEEAISDYSKAIEFKPDFAESYNARGRAKRDKGDMDGAIADYTKAIQINPQYHSAYRRRGYLRYDLHAFKDALADFRKVVEMDPSGDYCHFRIWLIRARLGELEAADMELKAYLLSRTTGKPNDWPAKIGHFLVGQLAEPEFLAAAKNADQKTELGQLCEAYFYAGSKRLFVNDKAIAMDYFQKAIATDSKIYTEHKSAAAELKFLKSQKN